MFLKFSLLLLYPIITSAANDWSTACVGSCSYETGDGTKTAWGTILLDGSTEVVSDISTAAGWSIMDCDDESTEAQDVRIVCHNPDSGCDHLFEGGAENTIVRLPEECAGAPFARVVSVTTSSNQTLSQNVAKLINSNARRRATAPEVMTITIDYNFRLIPHSRGTVSLTALATTNPLQRPMTNTQALRRALGYSDSGSLNSRSAPSPGELVRREALRRDLFADFVGGNIIPEGTTYGPANGTVSSKHTHSARWLDWEHDWNQPFDTLTIQTNFPVVDNGIPCPQNRDVPAYNATVKIDADVKVRATVSVGFIVAGSIIPPGINKAVFTSALDGGIEASFNMSSIAQGSFDTSLLSLFTIRLGGFSVPGIIDVGPKFSINSQGKGSIGVCTDAIVNAKYQFPSLSMVYPQDEGISNGRASQESSQNPLALSIGDSALPEGQVSVHLIPRVDMGVSVLFGLASASVFLQVDGYEELNLNLTAQKVSPSIAPSLWNRAIEEAPLPFPETLTSSNPFMISAPTTSSSSDASQSTDIPWSDSHSTSTVDKSTLSSDAETPNYIIPADSQTLAESTNIVLIHENRDVSDSYGGCVGVNLGIKIVAGAQGRLLSFWQDSVSFDIFAQDWPLFNKCLDTPDKRTAVYHHSDMDQSSQRSDLQQISTQSISASWMA